MNQLRLYKRSTRLLIAFMAITALLFVQTLGLHTHGLHDHHQHSGHTTTKHQHQAEIHLAAADLQDDEHDVASEIDLSTKGVVKNIKFNHLLLAVLTLFIVLLLPLLISNRGWLIRRAPPFNSHTLLLRPPLRAPPF